MDKAAVKQEALRRVLDTLNTEQMNAPGVQEVPPHEATCPSCGHMFVMGEGSYGEDVASES